MKRDADGRSLLLIGYGNPSRRDDGLGPALAGRIGRLELPFVRVETCRQLGIEHAATVAEYDFVIFADASIDGPAPFAFSRLSARPGGTPLGSHCMKPELLLYAANRLFHAAPHAYLLGIRGYDFKNFGETFSVKARVNLTHTVRFIGNVLSMARPSTMRSLRPRCGHPVRPIKKNGIPPRLRSQSTIVAVEW